MATITINIPDGKVNNIAKDLEQIFTRPNNLSDIEFVGKILVEKLKILRRAGKERKAIENLSSDDGDIT